jgi:hypothetical protein
VTADHTSNKTWPAASKDECRASKGILWPSAEGSRAQRIDPSETFTAKSLLNQLDDRLFSCQLSSLTISRPDVAQLLGARSSGRKKFPGMCRKWGPSFGTEGEGTE